MLTVNLFGVGQAYYHDQLLPGFPGQQHTLLFCYLLLHRARPHNREQLAAAFWGDHPTDVSRKYLSQALWRLRQTLQASGAAGDHYLAITNEQIAFAPTAPYWLDIETFEKTLAPYQQLPAAALTPEAAERLAQAVALYTGDLLEGIYVDWCLSVRERLHLLQLDALSRLMSYHEQHGDYERGLAYGERILSADNTREKVHCQMMRLYWLQGDRSAALSQYKRCAQILHEELGVPPMPETELLYTQMVHNQFVPAAPAIPTMTSVPANDPPTASHLLAQHALQKLNHLRLLIEKSSTELQQLEHLIQKAFRN